MKLPRGEFERLALEQLDMLYRLALSMTGSPHQAEDLVQDTFVRALRAWESFDLQACGMRPWLARIMHNLHLDGLSRQRRQPKPIDNEQLEAFAAEESLAGEALSLEGMDDQLKAALERLAAPYRSVLLLWAVEEFSYREIAQALDLPLGTVMSRLHRARQKLAAELHPAPRAAGNR